MRVWLTGVWLTGVWLTGAPKVASAWMSVWFTGVWFTGVWLTGAPWRPADITGEAVLVQLTPATFALVHQSVYEPVVVPTTVWICESGSFPSAKAIAGSVPSGLCDVSSSPITIGFVAFGCSGPGSGFSA